MLRRLVLALLALPIAAAAGAPLLPGRAPGFRPGFRFLDAWAVPGAVYDADLVDGLYTAGPPGLTRASPGYAADGARAYGRFGTDVLRRTDAGATIEPADTNRIRNNAGQGAVAGSPGVLPSNWGIFDPGGLTFSVVGAGVESGIDYVDIRIAGTPSANSVFAIYLETHTGVPAATGQPWSFSLFHKLAGGSFANLSGFRLGLDENDSGGSLVALGTVPIPSPSTTLSRAPAYGRVLSGGATVAALRPNYQASVTQGAPVDVTLRIGWPQMSQASRALSPIRTTAGAVTRQADVVTLPVAGVGRVVVTYDDGSTQTFAGIPTGTPWTIPAASLERSVIRRLTGFAS